MSEDTADTHKTTRVQQGAPPAPPAESCLVMIYGPEIGRRIVLREGELAFGRDESSDVMLPMDEVSRRHCAIRYTPTGISLRDLGSTNGTYLNDRELPPHEEFSLQSGDHVHIGGAIFKYLEGGNIEALYHEEIYRTAIIDGLTQVYNHRYFGEFLERELARCARHERPLALVIFDVDFFKQVNDRFGHVAGDHVLRELALVVKNTIRREECFARYGGEEFAAVLPESGAAQALRFAERIRGLVEHHEFVVEEERIPVTISLGVAAISSQITDAAALVRAADDRLYQAKHAGRNRVCGEQGPVAPALPLD